MKKTAIIDEIEKSKIIAIVRGFSPGSAEGISDALISGGITVIEFAIDHKRKDGVMEACRRISYTVEKYAGYVYVGAGTVLSAMEAKEVHSAGAGLIISPNTDPAVIKYSKDVGLVSIPGAMTATECVKAYNAGADYVKLFPAGELGIGYVKALMSPLCHIPFLLVGGITFENIKNYLDLGIRGFGLGSGLFPAGAVENGDFEAVRKRAELYANLLKEH